MLHVVVFGANGKVGRLVVSELLRRNCKVTVFVYGAHSFVSHPHLDVQSGDVRNFEDVQHALKGVDAVISALGSWGTKTKDILSTGMEQIIPAMKKQGIMRVVSLTGSAARVSGDKWGYGARIVRSFLRFIAPKILSDAERHALLLAQSKLEWTIIRSPIMTNRGAVKYVLNSKVPGAFETINRQAVAQALVDEVQRAEHLYQAPHLHR